MLPDQKVPIPTEVPITRLLDIESLFTKNEFCENPNELMPRKIKERKIVRMSRNYKKRISATSGQINLSSVNYNFEFKTAL